MSKLRATFYGGVGRVTGANFLIRTDAGTAMLVDCGLFQGFEFSEKENDMPFPYDPRDIKYLFVTHAHMDHIGRIPKLIHDGFRGIIYSTPETRALAPLMLEDALAVLTHEKKGPVLYDEKDIAGAMKCWREVSYHTPLLLEAELSVTLRDAGHILGSAMYEFKFGDKKAVFTGDLGNSPSPLLRDTEAVTDADYVVMESVYGDRNHEPPEERRRKLKEIVLANADRQGTLVIPAFSLERTQDLLSELDDMVEKKEIPVMPVFVDSPLAAKVTDIYRSMTDDFNDTAKGRLARGDGLFSFPRLKFTLRGTDSGAIWQAPDPKIIIAGSGMSSGGRVVRHEKHFLPNGNNTLLLAGYQSPGTIGRRLQEGEKYVAIDGDQVPVRAHIESVYGYSSHKDSAHLQEFVAGTASKVSQVFVVMGEPKASSFLVQRLRDYVGVNALVPERGKEYILG